MLINKYSICFAVFNVDSLYLRDRKERLPFHIETRLLCSYLRPETNVKYNKLELALKLLCKLFFIPRRHVNQKDNFLTFNFDYANELYVVDKNVLMIY